MCLQVFLVHLHSKLSDELQQRAAEVRGALVSHCASTLTEAAGVLAAAGKCALAEGMAAQLRARRSLALLKQGIDMEDFEFSASGVRTPASHVLLPCVCSPNVRLLLAIALACLAAACVRLGAA